MSTLNKYTAEARQAFAHAREEALRLRHRAVGPEHLLLGLLTLNDMLLESLFVSLHVSTLRVAQALEFVMGRGNRAYVSEPALNAAARHVITHAEEEAARAASELIGVEHLLLGIFGEENGVAAEEAQRLLVLEEELHKRVIGQHTAVQTVARAVRRSRTNLRDSHRPIGSFLFVGPTGVGKTELACALAGVLFGDENAMVKLDMSEFMENHTVSRLIGAPPGYVGYDSAGQLTEAVRRRPYSVVLLDEIEKAHPEVIDLLLQILDDGCLTDMHGKTVSFRNTLVIMTSNVGTVGLRAHEMAFTTHRRSREEQEATAHERLRSAVTPALKEMFKPELLNRIDEIVLFHTLEHRHLNEIVDIMIGQTQKRLAEQSITMEVSVEARNLLVQHGYDPVYGARPLRRTVQRMLEDMLADAILQGTCVPNDAIVVDVVNEQLHLHRATSVIVEMATTTSKYEAA